MLSKVQGILALHPGNLSLINVPQAIGSLISTPDVPQTKWNHSIPPAPLGAGSPAIGSSFANLFFSIRTKTG